MNRLPFTWKDLTWADLDPARHPFDSTTAGQVVRSLEPARHVPTRPQLPKSSTDMCDWSRQQAEPWVDAMALALVRHYGRWTAGWTWNRGEAGGGGGPIGNWCCGRDSVTTPEETLDQVVASLCEWRAWLEDLARWFERFPLDLDDLDDQRILWERSARTLILNVLDRTGAESGWYGHLFLVLSWFLNRWGIPPHTARELAGQVIDDRFRSWTAPDVVLVDTAAEELALALRPEHRAGSDGSPAGTRRQVSGPPLPDHLERWLAVRATVPWDQVEDRPAEGYGSRPSRDVVADDFRAFDYALDPARGEGLLSALELLRADLARGTRLDVDLLSGWQQHVLGTPQPPPFRTLPAFAKGGRERYGIGPDTRARLDACLAGSAPSDSPGLTLTARAARAFLDVCFFHPFDDGNARCALLTLVFVLAREGAVLTGVPLTRSVQLRADEPEDALMMTRFLQHSLFWPDGVPSRE